MPATFKDALDRKWTLALDVLVIQHVRVETREQLGKEIDLVDEEGRSYDLLAANPIFLVTVLHLMLADQIKEQELTPKQFAQGLVGDALTRASKALLQAIADFFPEHGRAVLTAVAAKQQRLRDVAHERAMEVLEDPQIDLLMETQLRSQMDAKLDEVLTPLKSATGSPVSSTAGTSEASPGESSTGAL